MDLMVPFEEKSAITKVPRIHHLGTVNSILYILMNEKVKTLTSWWCCRESQRITVEVCTKCHGSPSSNCQEISLKAKKCQQAHGTVEDKSRNNRSQQDSCTGVHECLQKFKAIHSFPNS